MLAYGLPGVMCEFQLMLVCFMRVYQTLILTAKELMSCIFKLIGTVEVLGHCACYPEINKVLTGLLLICHCYFSNF